MAPRQSSSGDKTKRNRPRGPERLSNILADLIIRRGYARQVAASVFQDAWASVVDERLISSSRPGNVRRGVLEVTVKNSIVMQELTFQKRQILKRMNEEVAGDDRSIRDIRFRIGPVE